jgi:DHA1 family inner membrane transport protein
VTADAINPTDDRRPAGRITTAAPAGEHLQWAPFLLVCVAYLVATTGEQMLSPLFPTAADDLGLSVARGGVAFGTLTVSIAIANIAGGLALRRSTPGLLIRTAAAVSAAGAVITALAPGFAVLLVGQVWMGVGAGLFFPAGLQAVAMLAGPSRKGFAMGIYGVAFSGGLTLAAILGAAGAASSWRAMFWIAGGLSALAAVCSLAIRVRPITPASGHERVTMRMVMSLPTAVGTVLSVCQYGAIPFLTTYAVDQWGISAASAATVLVAGRLISIVSKIVGGATADRIGALASGRRAGVALFVTGLAWILLPGGPVTYAIAALFVGMVSGLGPVANLLAVERYGGNGLALGAYRSVQIALGAAASATIGLLGDVVGLRPTLAVAALVPLALVYICRERT